METSLKGTYIKRFISDLHRIDRGYGFHPPVEKLYGVAKHLVESFPTLKYSHYSKPLTLPAILFYRWARANGHPDLPLKHVLKQAGVSPSHFFVVSRKIIQEGFKWEGMGVPMRGDINAVNRAILIISGNALDLVHVTALNLVKRYPLDFGYLPHVKACTSYSVAQDLLEIEDKIPNYVLGEKVGCSRSTVYRRHRQFFQNHPDLL